MVKSSPLGKQHQFWRAPGPQREGLQTQLCPGLLIRPCSLLVVPVRLQIFSTSESAENKQTHQSDTTDTQTTPARCRERARESEVNVTLRTGMHGIMFLLQTQSNARNILYSTQTQTQMVGWRIANIWYRCSDSELWKVTYHENMTFSMFKCYNRVPGASTNPEKENVKKDNPVTLFW